jgi:hypothetical protein
MSLDVSMVFGSQSFKQAVAFEKAPQNFFAPRGTLQHPV